ncbi:uncharacterized protein [Prorops nasuta]|uniref:uncharacterized protein n=1 Tax=Prorops nasuta TaxID=863751 RepID=UPI0034CFAF6A
MVKRKRTLQDGGGSSIAQAASLSVSSRSRLGGSRRKRLNRGQVMKMLSVREENAMVDGRSSSKGEASVSSDDMGALRDDRMENNNRDNSKEFLSSGRTGRRNALPDILGQHAGTGTADLPARLEALTTDPDEPSTSGGTSLVGQSSCTKQNG